jgi:hypothetical protein
MEIDHHLADRVSPLGVSNRSVFPDYGAFCISSAASLVEAAFGVASAATPLSDEIGAPSCKRVLFLIVDGLGYRALERLRGQRHVPGLDGLIAQGAYFPITSVFPATTAAAMASLATGVSPLAHGMLGYRLYLRETSSVVHMLRMRTLPDGTGPSIADAGLDPARFLPVPTLCERLSASGVATHVVLPRPIADSGLSQLVYRGCTRVVPAASFADMCVQGRTILASASEATCVLMYWPGLDSVGHLRGPDTDAYVAEAAAIDAVLSRELVSRRLNGLLLLTSDHGFVQMADEDYLDLAAIDGLADSLVRPPVGEPRASYLYARDPDGARSHVTEELAGGLVLLGRDRVLSSGLLGNGTPHPEAIHRIGDAAIVSTGRAALHHPYPDAVRLRGMHGGLTEDEMLVPLIASRL